MLHSSGRYLDDPQAQSCNPESIGRNISFPLSEFGWLSSNATPEGHKVQGLPHQKVALIKFFKFKKNFFINEICFSLV